MVKWVFYQNNEYWIDHWCSFIELLVSTFKVTVFLPNSDSYRCLVYDTSISAEIWVARLLISWEVFSRSNNETSDMFLVQQCWTDLPVHHNADFGSFRSVEQIGSNWASMRKWAMQLVFSIGILLVLWINLPLWGIFYEKIKIQIVYGSILTVDTLLFIDLRICRKELGSCYD